jgi:hypothetical protein
MGTDRHAKPETGTETGTAEEIDIVFDLARMDPSKHDMHGCLFCNCDRVNKLQVHEPHCIWLRAHVWIRDQQGQLAGVEVWPWPDGVARP